MTTEDEVKAFMNSVEGQDLHDAQASIRAAAVQLLKTRQPLHAISVVSNVLSELLLIAAPDYETSVRSLAETLIKAQKDIPERTPELLGELYRYLMDHEGEVPIL